LVLAASGADPNAERTGLVVSGNTAYMVWSTKLFIVDITNPLAPALLSSTTVATTSARDLVLTGTTLYIAADAKMLKYNVSNPAAPVLVHSTTTQSQAFAPAILDASHVLMLDSFDFGVGTGDFLEVLAA
jgi:hypothetical protein